MTEPASLEGRIAALESAVRSLMATNWTDRASVVDAAGNAVPLSSLAFGQVAAIWSGVGVVGATSVPGQAAPSQTDYTSWLYPADPHVDVLVRGGRLRVDWSALLYHTAASANPGASSWYYSYVVDYLGAGATPGPVGTRVVQPDYYRALMIRDPGAVGNYAEAGNWFMHTGLTPGWYRVSAAFRLQYSSTTTGSLAGGSADNPRIAATPF